MPQRILFVLSSAQKSLQGDPTVITALLLISCDTSSIILLQGWYLPEAAHPYYVLSPHFTIEFAAPAGPNPPMDPSSLEVNTIPNPIYHHSNISCLSNLKTMTTLSAS
jgi:hypothetical protein